MDNLSQQDIDFMDKILVLTIKKDWTQSIHQKLNITEKEYQFLIDKIIEFDKTNFQIIRIMDEGEEFQSIDNCFETERFVTNGGFKHFFENETNKKLEKNEIETLTKTNLHLSNEKLKYEEKTIRQLDEDLKFSSLLKNWWELIGLAIVVGITIGKYLNELIAVFSK